MWTIKLLSYVECSHCRLQAVPGGFVRPALFLNHCAAARHFYAGGTVLLFQVPNVFIFFILLTEF